MYIKIKGLFLTAVFYGVSVSLIAMDDEENNKKRRPDTILQNNGAKRARASSSATITPPNNSSNNEILLNQLNMFYNQYWSYHNQHHASATSNSLTYASQSNQQCVIPTVHNNNDLINAIKNREPLSRVKALIKSGAHVNQTDNEGNTPLICAVQLGAFTVVQYLLESGKLTQSNINHQNSNQWTAFNYALKDQNIEIIKLLAKYGADINYIVYTKHSASGKTPLAPLIYAVKKRNLDLVKCLIECKANTELTDMSGHTALFFAVRESSYKCKHRIICTEIAKYLIEKIPFINCQGKNKKVNPLWVAIHSNNLDMVKHLLKHKAQINEYNTLNWSITYSRILEYLLENKIDLNYREAANSESVLLQRLSSKIIALLTKYGANCNYIKRDDNVTPLNRAIRLNIDNDEALSIVKSLVEGGANTIDLADKNGNTVLSEASKRKFSDVEKYLKAAKFYLSKVASKSLSTEELEKILQEFESSSDLFKIAFANQHIGILYYLLLNQTAYNLTIDIIALLKQAAYSKWDKSLGILLYFIISEGLTNDKAIKDIKNKLWDIILKNPKHREAIRTALVKSNLPHFKQARENNSFTDIKFTHK